MDIFVAEGEKIVKELIKSDLKINKIIATEQWYATNYQKIENYDNICYIINRKDLDRISSLTTPQEVLAIVEKPTYSYDLKLLKNELVIALDSIQDPGNMGTIIRLADWFGINNILCSVNTVDVFNPKVIQSTMGSFVRVKVHYCDLMNVIEESIRIGIPVWGTFLHGKSIYEINFPNNGILVMGNEANGISKEIENIIQQKITIPHYQQNENKPESLNVAVATAIIISYAKSNNNYLIN